MGSCRVKLFFCLFLALAFVSSARLSISLPAASGDQNAVLGMVGGRRLMSVHLDDYGDTSANNGHDPPSAKMYRRH